MHRAEAGLPLFMKLTFITVLFAMVGEYREGEKRNQQEIKDSKIRGRAKKKNLNVVVFTVLHQAVEGFLCRQS